MLVTWRDPQSTLAMDFAFDDFVLDTQAHVLTRAGSPIEVEPQVFDLLHLLVRNAGKLVTRDAMVDAVWGGRIVSESAISTRIAAAGRAVGDNGKDQAIIQTVHRRGIKCVAALVAGIEPMLAAVGQPHIRYVAAKSDVNLAYLVAEQGTPILRIAQYPEPVSHLILQSGHVEGRNRRTGAGAVATTDNIAQMQREGWLSPSSPFFMGWIALYFPDETDVFWRKMDEAMRQFCPAENVINGRGLISNHSIADLLSKVQAQTLVIHCRRDAVHPLAQLQKLAKGIPNAELVVLETGNYLPMHGTPAWQVQTDATPGFLALPL